MEPTEAQYLIINALETLELLDQQTFDRDTGIWYISTPSPALTIAMILPSGDIARVNLPVNLPLQRTDAQTMIVNALSTLELLQQRFLDRETGNLYIRTPSRVLPIAIISPSGDLVPTDWML
ncbi:MAG: hypothetical protein AB4352_29300 [Hormoscilla sp.]